MKLKPELPSSPHKIVLYPVTILETYLDFFGHMNHATYLTLFEEARWDMITQGGYGLDRINITGLGPIIIECQIRYAKEIRVREKIVIETQLLSYERIIGKIQQRMLRGNEVCCTAVFTTGLMDMKKRKLVLPPPEWLHACGFSDV